MTLVYIAYKNMISKPLNLILSVLLLLLSVALVTFVFDLNQQLKQKLNKDIEPFDMVVGAKGSPLQLVLSSILHIDAPTGNIKLKDVEMLKKHPFVKATVPVSYGDSYKGYRILGTELEYLSYYNAELSKGKFYKATFEAIIGSNIAKRLGLDIGDTFISSHGLIDSDDASHDDHPYTVVGVLKPTGAVIDQLLITSLESIWDAHNHDHNEEDEDHNHDDHSYAENDHQHNHGEQYSESTSHNHDHEHEHEHNDKEHHSHYNNNYHSNHKDHSHDAHNHSTEKQINKAYDSNKDITSLLVKFKNPVGMVQLPRYINENTPVQAALPGYEIQRLLNLFGSGVKTINGIAFAILLVSGLSIFIGLVKTIRERRNELALLRTYGFSTLQLLKLVLIEGLFLTLIGFILGWLFGRIGIWLASQFTKAEYGYTLALNLPNVFELVLLGIVFVIAILATLIASKSIFKLNIVKTLSDA